MEKFDITKHFKKIDLWDKGFIELVNGPVIDPRLSITNAARCSYDKTSNELTEKDIKLVNFLFKSGHFSTFRHSYFTFIIKAPLIVMKQFTKYQIGSNIISDDGDKGEIEPFTDIGSIELPETNWNELSGRYVEFKPEFYIPEVIRIQDKVNNKQGSYGKLEQLTNGEDPVKYFEDACKETYDKYLYMVKSGAAKELCRMLLPQNLYSRLYWTASLQTILFVLEQRLKSDAQKEIQILARGILDLIAPILSPLQLIDPALLNAEPNQ